MSAVLGPIGIHVLVQRQVGAHANLAQTRDGLQRRTLHSDAALVRCTLHAPLAM